MKGRAGSKRAKGRGNRGSRGGGRGTQPGRGAGSGGRGTPGEGEDTGTPPQAANVGGATALEPAVPATTSSSAVSEVMFGSFACTITAPNTSPRQGSPGFILSTAAPANTTPTPAAGHVQSPASPPQPSTAAPANTTPIPAAGHVQSPTSPPQPSPPPLFLTPPSSSPPSYSSTAQTSQHLPTANGFLSYMERYCCDVPAQLWKYGSFRLVIKFVDLKRNDKSLAYTICNCNSQQRHSLSLYLKSAVRRFFLRPFSDLNLREKRYTEQQLREKLAQDTVLAVEGMPQSICPLDIFLQSKVSKMIDVNLVGKYQGTIVKPYTWKVPNLEEKGQHTYSFIIKYLTDSHKNGHCWNGEWSIKDWEVINSMKVNKHWEITPLTEFRLCKPPSAYDMSSGLNDLLAVVHKLIPVCHISAPKQFLHNPPSPGSAKLNKIYKPVFCQNFVDEIENMSSIAQVNSIPAAGQVSPTKEEYNEWVVIVLHHPFLMHYLASSNLEVGWCYEIKNQKLNREHSWSKVLHDTFPPVLQSQAVGPPWTDVFMAPDWNNQTHEALDKVFWFGRIRLDVDPSNPKKPQPFLNNVRDANKYHRMVIHHGMDHTELNKKQSLKQFKLELAMLAAVQDENRLPRMIKLMFEHKKINVDEFQREWKIYVATRTVIFN